MLLQLTASDSLMGETVVVDPAHFDIRLNIVRSVLLQYDFDEITDKLSANDITTKADGRHIVNAWLHVTLYDWYISISINGNLWYRTATQQFQ